MRFLPKGRHWSGWLLLPFRAYLVVAPICLFIWKFATEGDRPRGALAEATTPILFGYILCTLVFLLAAVIFFLTHRRELVAQNLLFAGIAFGIAFLIAPLAAVPRL